jgi:hypothetical protein
MYKITTEAFVAALYSTDTRIEISYWFRDRGEKPKNLGLTVRITKQGASQYGALHIHDLMKDRGKVDAHMKEGHYSQDRQFNQMKDTTASALYVDILALDSGGKIPWDSRNRNRPDGVATGFCNLDNRINLQMVKAVIANDNADWDGLRDLLKREKIKTRRKNWDNDAWNELVRWIIS